MREPQHSSFQMAADAFATADQIGIGGWAQNQHESFWFHETFTAAEIRNLMPALAWRSARWC